MNKPPPALVLACESRLPMQQLAQDMFWDALRSAGKDKVSSREEAFSALVQRQSAFVFRVAFAVLRNVHDAEDVAQETFLKLHRSQTGQQIENERAYLARIAWRIAVTRSQKIPHFTLPDVLVAPQPNPEQSAQQADTAQHIHAVIESLPVELRSVLLLSMTDDLTSHEIATIFNIPEGTVRNRLHRARQILKQKLEILHER